MAPSIQIPGPGAAAFIAAGICGYAASLPGIPDNITGAVIRGSLVVAVIYLGALGWKSEKLHRETARA